MFFFILFITLKGVLTRGFNPRLTNQLRGVVATPLRFFPGRSKTLKKITKGISVIFFYILCGHFHENKMGVPPYPGVM